MLSTVQTTRAKFSAGKSKQHERVCSPQIQKSNLIINWKSLLRLNIIISRCDCKKLWFSAIANTVSPTESLCFNLAKLEMYVIVINKVMHLNTEHKNAI